MHDGLYIFAKLQNISGRCSVLIDDEAAVLLRYLRTADGVSGKSGVLDQLSGKVPLRPLECAAGAGILQRLLTAALPGKFCHPLTDRGGIAGLQRKASCQNNQPIL